MSEKQAIRDRAKDVEKREREERRVVLADHTAKFNAERQAIQDACELAGGHEWSLLPDNGINQSHFITGEWPMWCGHCRKHRRFGWTERAGPMQPPDSHE